MKQHLGVHLKKKLCEYEKLKGGKCIESRRFLNRMVLSGGMIYGPSADIYTRNNPLQIHPGAERDEYLAMIDLVHRDGEGKPGISKEKKELAYKNLILWVPNFIERLKFFNRDVNRTIYEENNQSIFSVYNFNSMLDLGTETQGARELRYMLEKSKKPNKLTDELDNMISQNTGTFRNSLIKYRDSILQAPKSPKFPKSTIDLT